MYFIRRMAVNAIRVLGQSPEKIAEAYNFGSSRFRGVATKCSI
jgi:hypothetical protein